MAKFHINKHGVPAPCKARDGNCPYGGASGSDNHFDTYEEAQAHADKSNAAEFGMLGGVTSNEYSEKDFKFSMEDLDEMEGKHASVKYDGKFFSGEVIGTYYKGDGSYYNGVIIQDDEGTVKHIKADRMESLEITNIEKDIASEGRALANSVDSRIKDIPEPKLSFGKESITSREDLDDQIELNNEYITTHEHDPVENVQTMFNHVAGKAGKLYRFNDTDAPYLETHEYNFEEEMRNHENYLDNEGYFGESDYGKEARATFERNVADHRKLNDYTRELAVEYGKDYEMSVVLSGKYSREEQEKIAQDYRNKLADKVRGFITE